MMRLRPTALVVLVAVFCVAPPAVPRAMSQEVTAGVPWAGSVSVQRTVSEFVGLGAGIPVAPAPAGLPMALPDRSGLPQAGVVDRAQWVPSEDRLGASAGASAPMLAGPQTPSTTFTGATLSGAHPTFSFPANVMGDVGPTQYIVFVNGRIASYDKTTGAADGVLDVTPDVFFGGVNAGSPTRNPRIRYDRLSGRWFLTIINTSTPNRVLIAVSDAASNGVISGTTVFSFFFFAIDTPPPAIGTNCFADHPTLGIDANALYIGVHEFCGGPFTSADGFVVRKISVLSGGPLVVTALRGLIPNAASDGPYAPQGVDNYDPAATEGYFIGVSNTLFGKLVLRRVSDPGGAPTVSANIDIPVASTSFPIRVPHPFHTGGANGQLSAVDDRLSMAHLRNGRLWTVHNISLNNSGTVSGTRTRNGSRWYELQDIVSPGIPSLRQSGTVFTATIDNLVTEAHYWIPSIMVSGQGHALLGCSVAGALHYANAATTGRLAAGALGTMAAPSAYTSSTSSYNPPGDPGGPGGRRWGDHSYTSLDPGDDMTMWTIQDFCDVTDSYGCRVIKMLAPLPAAPASASTVGAGVSSVVTTVVGTSTAGSGFYDPGPNLGGGVPAYSHISATVTNTGVTGTPPTVNSVTYVDPTHVQLDLNTTGATANLTGEKYSVVITNPDGQMATGNQILRVIGPVGVGEPTGYAFALGPVWPNPARLAAEADLSLARETRVRVTVIDLSGREVATLVDGVQPAGSHHIAWEGRSGGARAPAGIYFMRAEAEGKVLVRRFAYLR